MQQQFIDIYREAHDQIATHSAQIFNDRRTGAATLAEQLPFPTAHTEEYLYCPLFNALTTDWGVNVNRLKFGLTPDKMFHCAVPGIKTSTVYFTNDVWVATGEETDLGNGAFACSMKYASLHHNGLVRQYFRSALTDDNDGFQILSDMLVQDGFFVYIPPYVQVEMPLQCVNMMRAGQALMGVNRNLIVVDHHASLEVIDCDHSMDDNAYFSIRNTEIIVAENARFNYCLMESTHANMNNLRRYAVKAYANASVDMSLFELTNGNSRNHVEVDLCGEGAEVWLGGMLLADGKQHTDNYTIIRHHAAHCRSNELFKYILDDEAVCAFSGRIVVDHGAQKTESYQTNRNICISTGAKALGRPQLEIYADDVKCGHGATTGMLDEAALFYMRQRGIGLKEARTLLLQAFSAEVLEHIKSQHLSDRLQLLIERRLRGETMTCAGCKKN